jgi:hypothetical protein
MIIRREQMETLQGHLLKSMATRLTERFGVEHPNFIIDAARLHREAEQLIEDVASLGIVGDRDVYRLLRFRILSESLLTSPLFQSVVIRTLHNLAWSADKRLLFLEREVLPRTGSAGVFGSRSGIEP